MAHCKVHMLMSGDTEMSFWFQNKDVIGEQPVIHSVLHSVRYMWYLVVYYNLSFCYIRNKDQGICIQHLEKHLLLSDGVCSIRLVFVHIQWILLSITFRLIKSFSFSNSNIAFMSVLPVFILSPIQHKPHPVVCSLESCVQLFLLRGSFRRAVQSCLDMWTPLGAFCVFVSLDFIIIIIIVLMWSKLVILLDMYPPDERIKWKF